MWFYHTNKTFFIVSENLQYKLIVAIVGRIKMPNYAVGHIDSQI